jgi:hypothetical protein
MGDTFRALGPESQRGANWFGPGNALQPIAPSEVAGRRLDLPFAYNRLIYPKQGDQAAVTPAQLRALSEGWDILRAVIETRKDRGCGVPLKFRDRDWTPSKAASAGVRKAESLFRRPDGQHTLTTWRRMLREDLYVLDAPTIYVNGRRGNVRSFEVIDGATIKILSDNFGRQPTSGPAFQQILKGTTAVDYTTEELIVWPRNPRPHKFYGFGPVEQAVITIETGLRRALGQLYSFTDGNIPAMFVSCPETWNPDQVKAMQEYFDAVMSGNLQARSGVVFIPGGTAPKSINSEAILKNEFDEWAARIICYFFSESPQPFVREMNRATAETANSSSMRDGTAAELVWEKDLIDELLDRAGLPEVECYHDSTVTPDPKTQNDIILARVDKGLLGKSAARRILGIAEEDAPDESEIPTVPIAAPVVPPEKETKKFDACGHDHAAKADLPPTDAEGPLLEAVQTLLDAYKIKADEIAQAAFSGQKLPDLKIPSADRKEFVQAVRTELGSQAMLAMSEASKLVTVQTDLSILEAPAKAWAADRAAWLVGMRYEGKRLVVNPNPEYQISDEVRTAIRSTVATAFEERWTPQQLSQAISESQAFSPRRSLMIARTEIAEAQSEGSMIYYRASGVKKKKWSGSANCCPLCQDNEAAGAIALGASFPSGHQRTPAHPNDRCRILPVESSSV